jgi:hypothetical protein
VILLADLSLAVALSAVWLTAGLYADGLAATRTAHELHHRAVVLSTLIGIGLALPAASLAIPDGNAPAVALPTAIPALVVLLVTVRRLGHARRGAGAIETTPHTPVPPALRATTAHPLMIVPVQVTGLASLLGLPIAGRLVSVPGAPLAGLVVTAVALAVTVTGVRAAIRHSRLAPAKAGTAAPVKPRKLVSAKG